MVMESSAESCSRLRSDSVLTRKRKRAIYGCPAAQSFGYGLLDQTMPEHPPSDTVERTVPLLALQPHSHPVLSQLPVRMRLHSASSLSPPLLPACPPAGRWLPLRYLPPLACYDARRHMVWRAHPLQPASGVRSFEATFLLALWPPDIVEADRCRLNIRKLCSPRQCLFAEREMATQVPATTRHSVTTGSLW